MFQINNFSIKVFLSIILLLTSSIAMLQSIDQSQATSSNIQRTYNLLNLSKNIQAKSFDFKNAAREYLILSASERVKQRMRLDQSHDYILNTLSLMQTLIANKPDQSKQLKAVQDTFVKVVFEFDNIQPKKGGLLIDGPRISILAEGSVSNLNVTLQNQLRAFDFLLQRSLKEQQQNASNKILLAEIMMLASLITGIGIMLYTLITLHREVKRPEDKEH
jgi:CHASE3 domain sensor protein